MACIAYSDFDQSDRGSEESLIALGDFLSDLSSQGSFEFDRTLRSYLRTFFETENLRWRGIAATYSEWSR